ncbi:TlpA disulfide reductase family protein [Williamsia sp. CHRR-6]|uniref:TlpA disulfide reductase family protein n=1 Tax=Williamsia sp. CHRR-6 TaxID=2835871 RepID=UPI001BDA3848|nr:TlpA disulfide reductase family protein [Williamsia sp. CHRR-6]MBT0565963.1 TlpA family protein disulfide reductase [Williamsia sp. CHRR-6]
MSVIARTRSRLRAAVVAVTAASIVIAVAGCGTGKDAVAQGDTFEFVSPGGKTTITYDPPTSRKKVRVIRGSDVVTGQQLSLDDFTGKVVVINVWGQWCGPCRGETAGLEDTYTATKDLGVEFLGINLRDNRQDAQDYIANRKITYPSIFDYPGRTLVDLTTPTSVVPTTVVLDRAHRAAAVFLRTVTADELSALVRRLAAESPPTPRVP